MTFFSLLKPVIERCPKFAVIYRAVRDQLSGMDKAKITPWGFKLSGNDTMAEGLFEPTETKVVRGILEDVDVLVNVGANVGYYCCHALSTGKQVIAFEPMPMNLHHLCRNIKENEWDGIEIFPMALSNSIGILKIYGGGTGASLLKGWANIPETYSTLVPCSTMDNVLGDRLNGKKAFILVDIEGAEYFMLQHAHEILNMNPKPIWMIEITSIQNQLDDVEINPRFKDTFNLFFKNGYEAFTADVKMSPVTIDDLDLALNKDNNLGYNFIFKAIRGDEH